jgi:MOSC domain-containing protein YiiM
VPASVTAVSRSASRGVSKSPARAITLVAGLGVDGDVHQGRKIRHRARMEHDPEQPNLRQVHLLHGELHDELRDQGFELEPGDMGENITTRGIDLLGLPTGTRLLVGDGAVIEVTGLRNPCAALDGLGEGLLAATLDRAPDGALIRKAGIMAIVVSGGEVRVGDPIRVEPPPGPPRPLVPV